MNNLCNPKYCLKMKILNGLLWIQWPWTFMHRCWCKLSYRFSEINVQACNSGLYGKYLFNILRNHQAVFRNGSTILHPHQHVGDIQFPYALKNTLFLFQAPWRLYVCGFNLHFSKRSWCCAFSMCLFVMYFPCFLIGFFGCICGFFVWFLLLFYC